MAGVGAQIHDGHALLLITLIDESPGNAGHKGARRNSGFGAFEAMADALTKIFSVANHLICMNT